MNKNQKVSIRDALKSRILVVDGAMGTALQDCNLSDADFGGPELEGCNENLILTRPDVIKKIHEDYLRAGCDIIETNTFGATPLVLNEYGLGEKAREINLAAAHLARQCADTFSTPEQPRFVAGSIGPTTKAISVTGGITFEELQENFYAQAKALWDGGVDYLLLETCQDTRNIKAALLAIDTLSKETQQDIPIAISGTIEPMGTMLGGQSIEALLTSVQNYPLLYIGLNCATGPEFMTDHIRSLAKLSPFPVSCVPNAGLPDENGCYLETPESVGQIMGRFLNNGWLNVVGGCCGTHAGHIAKLRELAKDSKPRVANPPRISTLSGVDYLEITDEMRPVLVGERTNVIGSRKFKDLICEERFDEASDIARAQIKTGAQIIDVCLANPDRNELEDMRNFLEPLVKKVRAPLMIDSTDEEVIEMALTYCQGKAIINSINLEDGEERFEKVLPLAKKFGAALVVGTIDDDPQHGMGVTRARKLEIAKRSFKLLTEKYGIPATDIYWDPLVFPCATGDTQYTGSALETIEGIRLLKKEFPECKTVLGISNVSFGLPPAGREVLNSVFLYHCVQAGLDLALVNSEKLVRYNSIPENEKLLADNLLFNRNSNDPIAEFANHFRAAKVKKSETQAKLPLDQRLPLYVLEGSKDGLVADLNEALKTMPPLEIINGPLMKGMDEVGRLFGQNKLIVAEVLQSAEVMKSAVAHLQPFMEKKSASTRGKVILATVKGDVHDIGKNLVEIILANNGFEVINLGIKIPPEQLIQAIRHHKPDLVGLSGLLVKSAQQMIATAEDLSKAQVTPPMLVGGAALSEKFVDTRIAPAYSGDVTYASDAMQGLELAKVFTQPQALAKYRAEQIEKRAARALNHAAVARPALAPASEDRSKLVPLLPTESLPKAPDFERHVLKNTPIEQIWSFINPLMLYGRHLGIKGGTVRLLGENPAKVEDAKARAIWDAVEEVKSEYGHSDVLRPGAVYQFFKCASQGNTVIIYSDQNSSKELTRFVFPRQQKADGLCLADYVMPSHLNTPDSIACFVTTIGKNVRELAELLKNRGEYLKSHILQVLALESAEAYAEFIHSHIRKLWGYSDPIEMTMMQRFQAKYHGKRYSFGYPACPKLDDQLPLFQLLKPEGVGVQLTDGFMMDPEASVSALVFHHPEATYFSVGEGIDGNR